MIEGLKPYPAYKDSGVEWLGQVPAHWEVRRLESFVTNSVEQAAITAPSLETVNTMFFSAFYKGYQAVYVKLWL